MGYKDLDWIHVTAGRVQ